MNMSEQIEQVLTGLLASGKIDQRRADLIRQARDAQYSEADRVEVVVNANVDSSKQPRPSPFRPVTSDSAEWDAT